MTNETWKLFRYRPASDFLLSEISNSEIYCAHPDALNDPFDCRIEWKPAFLRALSNRSISKQRRKIIESIRYQFSLKDPHLGAGIACFTIKADDQLMWAHYAKNHTGVCLYYEIPRSYFWDKYPADGREHFFGGATQVFYGQNAFTRWLISGNLTEASDDPAGSTVARIFSTKSKCWEHEEEYRVVMNRPGAIYLEPSFLKQVTFGLKTSELDRKEISRLALTRNPDVLIGRVEKCPHSDFGLKFPN